MISRTLIQKRIDFSVYSVGVDSQSNHDTVRTVSGILVASIIDQAIGFKQSEIIEIELSIFVENEDLSYIFFNEIVAGFFIFVKTYLRNYGEQN